MQGLPFCELGDGDAVISTVTVLWLGAAAPRAEEGRRNAVVHFTVTGFELVHQRELCARYQRMNFGTCCAPLTVFCCLC